MLVMILSFLFFFSMVNNGQHSLAPRKIFAYEHFVSFVVANIEVSFSLRNVLINIWLSLVKNCSHIQIIFYLQGFQLPQISWTVGSVSLCLFGKSTFN